MTRGGGGNGRRGARAFANFLPIHTTADGCEMADYYAILGVGRDAEQTEIRRAFRRLAREHHPDLNPDDSDAEAKFKRVNEAHEVLSNPESRRKYDAHGDDWRRADEIEAQRRQRRAPRTDYDFGGARGYSDSDLFAGLEDVLGDLGGFGRRARGAAMGGISAETPVDVSLREAHDGTTVTANLTIRSASRRFEVDIPPGVDNGSVVKVTPERGSELLFRVSVAPDPRFRREGADLYADLRAPFEDVVLGGEAEIETLDGRRISVSIPEGSRDGRNIRLRGQGMPKLGAPETKGDLYAVVRPVLPGRLTGERRELIERFRELSAEG